jgi:hypothetical protein
MFAFSVSTIVFVGSLVDLTAGSSDSRATRKARAEWNNKKDASPFGRGRSHAEYSRFHSTVPCAIAQGICRWLSEVWI